MPSLASLRLPRNSNGPCRSTQLPNAAYHRQEQGKYGKPQITLTSWARDRAAAASCAESSPEMAVWFPMLGKDNGGAIARGDCRHCSRGV